MIIFAHRGARAYCLENTISSFKKAIKLKAEYIELDVRICKSGEIIVIHDATTKRVANTTKNISQTNFKKLSKCILKDNSILATLEDVLKLSSGKIKLNIELKGKGTAEPVAKLLKKYISENKFKYEDFLISSFYKKELVRFNRLMPRVRIGVLFRAYPTSVYMFIGLINVYSVHVDKKFINRTLVCLYHIFGIKVFVYTVNSKRKILKLKKIKVDGVFTDYPDILK